MENFKFTVPIYWLKEYTSEILFTALTENIVYGKDILTISHNKGIVTVENDLTKVTFEEPTEKFLEAISNLHKVHN